MAPLTSGFGPLVSVDWLIAHSDDAELRIADCRWYLDEPGRGRAEHIAGHIPGARYVSLDDDLSAEHGPGRHPLPDPEALAGHLGALGFGDHHTIVVYDSRGGAIAARMWWMLRSIGHERVAVLDGGITAWEASGGPFSTEPVDMDPARLTVRRTPTTINADDLASKLGEPTLLDAREPIRYRGEHEPIDPVAGHIPTAINAPYLDNLDASGFFLSAGELRERFAALGVERAEGVVVYCGSGVTACHLVLAMEHAGLGWATLYAGSWSDWSSQPRRIAVGESPGNP